MSVGKNQGVAPDRFDEAGQPIYDDKLTNPKDPQAELRDLVYRLKYPPLKGAYQVKVDDVMKAFQAHQQELLSELLSHSKTLLDGMNVADFVPVSVIERKIGELNG